MGDWFDEGGRGARCDVPALLDSAGGAALADLVGEGALLSLGLTRDGGALGVTVTVDGRWRRVYVRDPESLMEFVSEALPAVREAVAALSASSAQGNGKRGRRGL